MSAVASYGGPRIRASAARQRIAGLLSHVRELFRMPWPDGADSRLWHAALLELESDGWHDAQPVNISYTPPRETQQQRE